MTTPSTTDDASNLSPVTTKANTRRTHQKSRHGCAECRRRKVKVCYPKRLAIPRFRHTCDVSKALATCWLIPIGLFIVQRRQTPLLSLYSARCSVPLFRRFGSKSRKPRVPKLRQEGCQFESIPGASI